MNLKQLEALADCLAKGLPQLPEVEALIISHICFKETSSLKNGRFLLFFMR